MGTGSSRKRQVNRQTQVPPSPIKSLRRTPSPPPPRRPSPPPSSLNKNKSDDDTLAHYANIWEQNGKLSTTFEQLIQSESTKIEHSQQEINQNENTTKHLSSYQSAQIESTLTSQVESIHTLQTSQQLDQLMIDLKQTHQHFDEAVQRRIGQITLETECILQQIVQETQLSQQRLLIHAKEQQTIQDAQYRILLEDFIQKLDEKRAKQLDSIQQQIQQQRLQIFDQSQLKIRALTEQANYLKTSIMNQEEKKATEKIESIVNEINSISTESAIQHIGSQVKTNINLTLIQTVGANNEQNNIQVKRTTYLSSSHLQKKTTS